MGLVRTRVGRKMCRNRSAGNERVSARIHCYALREVCILTAKKGCVFQGGASGVEFDHETVAYSQTRAKRAKAAKRGLRGTRGRWKISRGGPATDIRAARAVHRNAQGCVLRASPNQCRVNQVAGGIEFRHERIGGAAHTLSNWIGRKPRRPG